MGSLKSTSSVAFMNANFLPAAATDVQLMVPCQWLMSMPSSLVPGVGRAGWASGSGSAWVSESGSGVGGGATVTAVLNSPLAA